MKIPKSAPFTIAVPIGTNSITISLRCTNLDPNNDGSSWLQCTTIGCAVDVTEDYMLSPGSGYAHTDALPLNGLLLTPAVVAGGTYLSQLKGDFTNIVAGASVIVTPSPGTTEFDVQIDAEIS